MSDHPPSVRIVGYDFARAIAILGMIVHHFVMAMAADQKNPVWLARILGITDGRPAALFVILAGVGISLRSRRVVESSDADRISDERRSLMRRGVVLLFLGFLNLLVWPGDILRVYGVSLFLAAGLIDASARRLLSVSVLFVAGFYVLFVLVDYEKNWDWSNLKYHGLWTPMGCLRNLFYDGFRSVFPWTGLLIFGMWLGRLDLRNHATNRRCLAISLTIMLLSEILSALCVWQLLTGESSLENQELVRALFGTESMPPMPFFVGAAGGFAVAVIAFSVRLTEVWWQNLFVKTMVATGQLALTWYIAHIYLGLGAVVALDALGNQTLGIAAACGTAFFVMAMCLSVVWKQWFTIGPLEWVMRRCTAGPRSSLA